MSQIKGTWKHDSVPNVAIKLTEIGNRETSAQTVLTERFFVLSALSITSNKTTAFWGKEVGQVLTRHRHQSASSLFSIFNY